MDSTETISQAEPSRMLTVRLPESLHRKARIEAAKDAITIQSIVESALRMYFGADASGEGPEHTSGA